MSRYRVVLSTGRVIESPKKIQTPAGAKRFAATWASTVGIEGHIELQERVVTPGWVTLGRWKVRNSEITEWEEG